MKTPELLHALKATLKKLEEVTSSISSVKDLLPITHPIQNMLAYDCTKEFEIAEHAIAKAERESE